MIRKSGVLHGLVAAALIPLLLFAVVVAILFDQENRHNVEDRLRQAATSSMSAVDQLIVRDFAVLDALAISASLDRADFAAFRLEALRVLDNAPYWLTIRLTDPATGLEIVNLTTPEGVPLPRAPDQPGLARAIEAGRAVLSGVIVPDDPDHSPFVLLRVPVARNGTVRYILSGAMPALEFAAVLQGQGLPEDWFSGVFDRDMRVVSRDRAEDGRDEAMGQVAPPAIRNGVHRNDGAFFAESLLGEPVLIGHATSPETGWTVTVGAPADQISQSLRKSRAVMTASGGLALLLTIGLGSFVVGAVRRRQEQADQIAYQGLMLRETDHRVKNSLQLVSSVIGLQAAQTPDPEAKRLFADAARRVQTVARVHERLYQTETAASVDIAAYVRTLCDDLASSLGTESRGRLLFEGDVTDRIGVDKAIPVALIVNELVTNAFKHAAEGTEQPATVTVGLSRAEDGWLALSVSDTGPGLPADFDPDAQRSLGMKLIRAMVAQLGGDFDIGRDGCGAQFVVRMPVE